MSAQDERSDTVSSTDHATPTRRTYLGVTLLAVGLLVGASIIEAVSIEASGPVNVSGCRSDLPGSTMTVTVPEISYHCNVYPGDQSVIDSGAVTVMTNVGWSGLSDHPGAAGTLWLAGHRSTHGASFAAVPDLADGALVTITEGDVTAVYQIVGRTYVEMGSEGLVLDAAGQPSSDATADAVLRPDRGGDGAPRLLLQTCEGASFRWMIYADLVS